VNGALDAANVDKTSADGIMVLNTAQTRTGTLTHNGDIIVGNGYGLTIGNASQVTTSAAGEFQVLGTAAADSTAIIGRFAADASPPILSFLKSRHATIGSNTIVADNDVLGQIEFMGADGSDFATPGAAIFARVNGTPGANDMPTELVFATTADAGNSVTEQWSVLANGDLVPITDSGKNIGSASNRVLVVFTDTLGDAAQGLTIASSSIVAAANPAFMAKPSGTLADVSGDGTAYTIVYATEIFDQNADFDGTSTFTAPVTGRYHFDVVTALAQLASGHTVASMNIVASNRTVNVAYCNPYAMAGGGTDLNLVGSILVDMDASDTCTVSVTVTGAAKAVDVGAGSYFSGYLAT